MAVNLASYNPKDCQEEALRVDIDPSQLLQTSCDRDPSALIYNMELSGYRPSCWRPLRRTSTYTATMVLSMPNASHALNKGVQLGRQRCTHDTCFISGMDVGHIGGSVVGWTCVPPLTTTYVLPTRTASKAVFVQSNFQLEVSVIPVQKCCSIFFSQRAVRRARISAGHLRMEAIRLEGVWQMVTDLDLV